MAVGSVMTVRGIIASMRQKSLNCSKAINFVGTDHMLGLLDSGKVLSWGTGWQGQLGRIPKSVYQTFTKAQHKYKGLKSEVENLEDKLEKETSDAKIAGLESELKQLRQKLNAERNEFDPLEKNLRKRQLTPTKVQIPAR